jgi:hypothetical protein
MTQSRRLKVCAVFHPDETGGHLEYNGLHFYCVPEAELARLTAERDALQNELCTTRDQIPDAGDGESLSVAIIRMRDRYQIALKELAKTLLVVKSRMEKIDEPAWSGYALGDYVEMADKALALPGVRAVEDGA